ncbi:MAG: patatin-like phospholipase family protein [Prevotella sp.]|nr:patatin-like phospholipase family protein [Prevotella sp.]
MTKGTKKKDVALVLSSGGAKGLAHIGAIEELETHGYHISSIAGCSMGALIGGVYAAGKLEEFREWMKTVDKKKMLELTDFSLSLNHLVKGKKIIEAIMEFVPDVAIEDLPIPFCVVATDLKAGKEVLITKGSLFQAIRASISIPSFYEPVQRDDMILVDGGIVNPTPLNRVQRQPEDILVGIDVSGHDYKAQWEEHQNLNYFTVLSRSSSLMIHQNSLLMAKIMKPDIFVGVQMGQYGIFDYDKSEEIIAVGRLKTALAISQYEENARSSTGFLKKLFPFW